MSARRLILASALALAACFGAAAQTVPQLGAPSQADFLVPPMLPLLQAISAGGPVALAANATAATAFAGSPLVSPQINANLTIGVVANECLVIEVGVFSATPSFPTSETATWNGTSVPLIGTASFVTAGQAVYLFGLPAAASGNHTISFAWVGGTVSAVSINGTSFSGCNQTGGVTTFPNAASLTGTTGAPSQSLTNPTGDIAVNIACSAQNVITPSATLLFTDQAQTGCGSQFSAAVNPTVSWTTGASAAWLSLSASIAHN